MEDDAGSYYLLSYTPTNATPDGAFRKITIKLKRPRLTAQGRSGYYALAENMPTPVLAHEAGALASLEARPRPTSVSLKGEAFTFPGVTGGKVVVLVDTPRGGWSVERDAKAGLLRQDGVVLAVVRDATGRAVRKLSQRYALADHPTTALSCRRAASSSTRRRPCNRGPTPSTS